MSSLRAFQLFFALHCAGFLALLVASEGEQGLRPILKLLAVGSEPAPGWPLGTAPWQLATSTFLHLHPLEFTAAVVLLLAAGPEVERALGSARFTALYLGAGAAIALAQRGLVAAGATPALHLGGLGAGAALVSAAVLLDPGRRAFGVIPAPGFFLVVVSAAFAIAAYLDAEPVRRLDDLLRAPLASGDDAQRTWLDRASQLSYRSAAGLPHLLGFSLGAALLALDLGCGYAIGRARVRSEIRSLEEELEARARVEQLLEKISRQGVGALSRRERSFLRYASSRFYPNRSNAAS